KDASLGRSKKRAELTKEFRKKSDQEKVAGVQRLVKAYQEEIDTLAKRCRASDSAFFSLYKGLYEAPDPAKALERSASERPRAAASELEVQKLRSELAEYEEEFSKLKNQAADAKMEAAREREAQLAKSISSVCHRHPIATTRTVNNILSACGTREQAQLTRLEQELQQLRDNREGSGLSPSATTSTTVSPQTAGAGPSAPGGVAGGGGGVSHAEAVDAELTELTRVNSQLRGELVARSSAWREEKV
ncbi:unnamed protein product, partial [Ectocarpus fasciculatus]